MQKWPLLRRTKESLCKSKSAPAEGGSPNMVKRGILHKGLLAAAALILAVVMLFAMTAAWYKNVVQTAGLIFHVDQWGLDSSVNIQNELINAAPGDTGMITMSVENSSGGIIGVNLGVSTANGTEDIADMRKRLFFYIDDMAYRGGEHTPRVYLNTQEYYSYTVLPEHDLHLGDNGNASPLVWEWVFDVVGYYFYGTVTESSEADIDEYLRPVEYKLDDATFYNGVLTTVDGTTPPDEFIRELSESDGYEGTVTTTVTASDGRIYYPVTVDDSGKGVWIYLCNLGEIERETVLDTQLGASDEEKRQFEIYLHVTAQQRQLEVAQVSTADQLQEALNNLAYDMVQLTDNVALSEILTVGGTGEKILDLDGHTLSTTASTLAQVQEGASLTVMDGTLKGAGTSSAYGVEIKGGDVSMSGVTLTDTAQGVRILDYSSSYNDSRVTLTGCTIYSTVAGINLHGNGARTAADTVLVIDNCLIESTGYYALTGGGNTTSAGTDVHILNSRLRAIGPTGTAIYHPQRDSTLLVEDSVLEGFTTMAIKGGNVTLLDTQVLATAREGTKPQTPAFSGSGYVNTGAAVYVETGYNYPCTITIGGDSVVTSENAEALIFYESTNPLYELTVTGGSYSHDVTAFLADGYVCKKDGDYWVVTKE